MTTLPRNSPDRDPLPSRGRRAPVAGPPVPLDGHCAPVGSRSCARKTSVRRSDSMIGAKPAVRVGPRPPPAAPAPLSSPPRSSRDVRRDPCLDRVPPGFRLQSPVLPLLPSSHLDQTYRLLTVCHVPPFSNRCRYLLWRLLTSADPSRPLSEPVAAAQQAVRSPRVRRATFPLIPAASTVTLSVQVSDFEEFGLLIQRRCLRCDSCSSGQ